MSVGTKGDAFKATNKIERLLSCKTARTGEMSKRDLCLLPPVVSASTLEGVCKVNCARHSAGAQIKSLGFDVIHTSNPDPFIPQTTNTRILQQTPPPLIQEQ